MCHVQAPQFPKGYPTGRVPPGMEPNLADYEDRCGDACSPTLTLLTHTRCGPFCARLVLLGVVGQQLIKSYLFMLDLGKFDEESMKNWDAVNSARANRDRMTLRVPAGLATKSFTSKNADEEMVNSCLRRSLTRGWAGALVCGLEWTIAAVAVRR